MPALTGIDHIHVYVDDRAAAERWYRDVLGFTVVEKFRFWATPDGPLTLENAEGNVHLALFRAEQADGNVGDRIRCERRAIPGVENAPGECGPRSSHCRSRRGVVTLFRRPLRQYARDNDVRARFRACSPAGELAAARHVYLNGRNDPILTGNDHPLGRVSTKVWPSSLRARMGLSPMREFDAVQGIILATLLGALVWTLIAVGVFG